MYVISGGGYGGHPAGDGLTNGCSTIGISKAAPVEVQEQLYPVLFERYAIHEGSGGLGEFRGGMGIHYRIRLRAGSARASMVMDHGKFGPPGAAGGQEGGRTRVTIYRGDQAYVPAHVSKDQSIVMQAGDVTDVYTPGGGAMATPRCARSKRWRTTADRATIRREAISTRTRTWLSPYPRGRADFTRHSCLPPRLRCASPCRPGSNDPRSRAARATSAGACFVRPHPATGARWPRRSTGVPGRASGCARAWSAPWWEYAAAGPRRHGAGTHRGSLPAGSRNCPPAACGMQYRRSSAQPRRRRGGFEDLRDLHWRGPDGGQSRDRRLQHHAQLNHLQRIRLLHHDIALENGRIVAANSRPR